MMVRLFLMVVCYLALNTGQAFADEHQNAGVRVLAPDRLQRTESDEEVRLAYVWFPQTESGELREQAGALLKQLVAGQTFAVQSMGEPDRYGRGAVWLEKADGTVVNTAMIEAGYGIVFAPEADARLKKLLQTESAARSARRGLWALPEFRPIDHLQAQEREHRFTLVEGVIQDVAVVRGKTYLNFGDNWRTDFTAMIPKEAGKAFQAVVPTESLKGKRVRVRGWVYPYFGPQIELTNPYLLEVLE